MVQKLDFITPTFVRVLDFFMADPLQEHHEREVMRLVGVSKGSANRILHELCDRGFLTAKRKGRMVFYKLDLQSPSARQFKILSNVYSLGKLLERLKGISRRVILFGSSAKGTDVKESDIDLLILTDNREAARNEINGFNNSSKGERRIAPIIVDANELAKMRREDSALYENIERGIILWETEE
jgi:predicted nucleotidyltransferase